MKKPIEKNTETLLQQSASLTDEHITDNDDPVPEKISQNDDPFSLDSSLNDNPSFF